MTRAMYLGSGISLDKMTPKQADYVLHNFGQFIFNIVTPTDAERIKTHNAATCNIQYIPWDTMYNVPLWRVPADAEWCIPYAIRTRFSGDIPDRPSYDADVKLAPFENVDYVGVLVQVIREHAKRWGPEGAGMIDGYCFEGLYNDPRYMWPGWVDTHPDLYDRKQWHRNMVGLLIAMRRICTNHGMLLTSGGTKNALTQLWMRTQADCIKVEHPEGYIQAYKDTHPYGPSWPYLEWSSDADFGGLAWYKNNLKAPALKDKPLAHSWIEVHRKLEWSDPVWMSKYANWADIARRHGAAITWAWEYKAHVGHCHIPMLPGEVIN